MDEPSNSEITSRRYERIIQSYMFEQEMYSRISATLSTEEKSKFNELRTPIIRSNGSFFRSYRPNIYLPIGCKQLEFNGPTYIYTKNRLIPGTISRYKRLFYELKKAPDNKVDNFVIVYQEADIEKEYIKNANEDWFQILDVSDLEDRGLKESNKEKGLPKDNQKSLIEKAKQTFESGDIVLFLGAGVSMSVGLPSWDKLLKKIMKKGTSVPESDFDFISEQCFDSSIITARYIKNLYRNEHESKKGKALPNENIELTFKEMLLTELYPSELNIKDNNKEKYKLIKNIGSMISSKKVESIITYNYDDLMEQELERRNINYTSINGKNRWLKGDIPIYHVHGLLLSDKKDIMDSDIILSEREYHKAYKESYNWATVEQLHALRYKCCFFIGLSMSDPNLRRLLDLATEGSDKELHHFVFLQNKTKSPFHTPKNAEIIQSMMNGFGLNVIWYQEHDDLPGILNQICSSMEEEQSTPKQTDSNDEENHCV